MPKNKISVWDYFEKNSFGLPQANCCKCRKTYKTSGNTSNLWDHLLRAHKINPKNPQNGSGSDSELEECRPPQQKKQKVLSFESYLYKRSDKKKIYLDKYVVAMIVLDMQPFSVVSDSGFKQLIKKLDSKYELPSKTTIKQRLLPELYNEIKEKLRRYLETVESVALTTDLWTSNYSTISYMTVTCHFLKEKKLVSTVLDTLQLAGTHNAENISTCLQDIIKTWKLDGKVLAVVTDNASNMLLACKIIKLEHLPCFAHTLNLTVEDGIKKTENLEELLKKCRDIVSYFKRSTKASDCLREEQRQRNEATLKVIQVEINFSNLTFVKNIYYRTCQQDGTALS
jgi:hypothetical protein